MRKPGKWASRFEWERFYQRLENQAQHKEADMADKRMPAFRLYVSNKDGEVDFKGDDIALWENESKSGKKYYGGKLKDGRKLVMFAVEPKVAPKDDAYDIPF